MTEQSTLNAAVAACPDDDLPRLAFADWLEEHGDPDRAEFIRAQVRLAGCPPWDPFAVTCRHRRTDWLDGQRWWGTLPPVDGHAIEWHPDRAFRRGFGHAVIVRDVRYLLEIAPRLFAMAPIGELHLPTATLDEWRAFARAEWLPRVRAVHFYSTTTPIEPIRELMASPNASGINEIVFGVANGAGLPELLTDVAKSPLGRRLCRLEFLNGPFNADYLIGTIANADWPNLRHLALTNFGASESALRTAIGSGCHQRLSSLRLANLHVAGVGQFTPWPHTMAAALSRTDVPDLRLNGVGLGGSCLGLFGMARSLTRLDLADNVGTHDLDGLNEIGTRVGLKSLRSLCLRRSGIDDEFLQAITDTGLWANLVELDLRDNAVSDAGAGHLLRVAVPPDLAALLLGGNRLSETGKAKLRGHFGERVIL